MKHTKGPWTNFKGLIHQSDNLGIARIVSSGTDADAQLIAAAPELLEWLKFAYDLLTQRGIYIDPDNTAGIESAIAKAEGTDK